MQPSVERDQTRDHWPRDSREHGKPICEDTSTNRGRLPRQTWFSCLLPGKDKYLLLEVCGRLYEQHKPRQCVFGAVRPVQLLKPPGKSGSSSGPRHLPGGGPASQPGPHAAPSATHAPARPRASASRQASASVPRLGHRAFAFRGLRQPQKGRCMVFTGWTFTLAKTPVCRQDAFHPHSSLSPGENVSTQTRGPHVGSRALPGGHRLWGAWIVSTTSLFYFFNFNILNSTYLILNI